MLKQSYQKLRALAASEKAEPALAMVSFAEASFFPLPPDIMLIPMVVARPDRAWRSAAIATIASVLGGILGYLIGMFLMDGIGKPLLDFYGYGARLDDYNAAFAKYGTAIILIKGLTPIPFKLVTIASGLAHFNLAIFIAASVVTRGARFFLVAGLTKKFGPAIEPFIEKQLYWITGALALIIIAGFFAAAHMA
jgi:membrane protein YqaA with SNARE-associated domain